MNKLLVNLTSWAKKGNRKKSVFDRQYNFQLTPQKYNMQFNLKKQFYEENSKTICCEILFPVRSAFSEPIYRAEIHQGWISTIIVQLVSFIIYLFSNYEMHQASIKNRRFHRIRIGGIDILVI